MTDADINAQVRAMRTMTVPQLQRRFAEVWGEPSRSRHKVHLIRRIAWRMQALAEGDLPERARRRALELADDSMLRLRPPRGPRRAEEGGTVVTAALPALTDDAAGEGLPIPGTLLTRVYRGRRVAVRVLPKGFEYDGEVYRSLSAVAKAVTGSHWSGNLFFGIRPVRRGRSGGAE
jgi:hypothetical protein